MTIAVANQGYVVPKMLRGTESFLLYDIEGGRAVNERERCFGGTGMDALRALLLRDGVELLICGAVEEADRQKLEAGGLQVIYGITNGVVVALDRYLDGVLQSVETDGTGAYVSDKRAHCYGNCAICKNPCHA